jgi:cytochrome c
MDDLKWNKIAGGVLAASLLIFGGKTLAGISWKEPTAKEPGYKLAVAAAATGGAAAAAFDPKAVIEGLKKAGAVNVEAGKDVFKKCAACHTPNKGGENKVGPNVYGVLGRKVAGHTGFAYSESLKTKGGDWTYESLARYLNNPRDAIPGNKMAFAGLPDAQDLVDVLAYLRTLADTPVSLPN